MGEIDQDRDRSRKRLLGTGLRLVPILPGVDLGRDLVLERGDGGLDFARIEGIENLGQDLTVAMTTLLGSDLFNSDFGFDGLNALVEETDTVLARERIRVAVILVLKKDARVRDILDVNLDDQRLRPQPAGSRELNIQVEFNTVSGDQASLGLGKVAANG
jgi:hypothetical protein